MIIRKFLSSNKDKFKSKRLLRLITYDDEYYVNQVDEKMQLEED